MEPFFVVVLAGAVLGVALWALLALRGLSHLNDRSTGDD